MEQIYTSSITALTYSEELEILSIGFRDGTIECCSLNVEVDKEGYDDDDVEEYFSEDDEPEMRDKNKGKSGRNGIKKAFEQIDNEKNIQRPVSKTVV